MINDIQELLSQNENRKLEFKQTLPSKEKIIKTAIAFSNSQGGDLVKELNIIEQRGTGFKKAQDELREYPEIEVHNR